MAGLLQHLINGLAEGTIYALVALGYTMVYGVLKLINFAHGDVMMVGAYVGYAAAFVLGDGALGSLWGAVLVFLVSILFCGLLGWLVERFAYRPLREKPRLTALITAIGISFTLSYGFQLKVQPEIAGKKVTLLPGADPRTFPEIITPAEWVTLHVPAPAPAPDEVDPAAPHDAADDFVEIIIWNWQVISFVIALALMGGLQVLVFRTKFGRAMRAVSHDHRVAALLGIPVDRVIALTFMLGSALAACAGILYAIKDTLIQPMLGVQLGLKAFVAAVIGGIGNVQGAVLGAVALALCEELVVGYASSSWRDAVAFGFLIVVLLLRPQGLLGRVQAEKV
ncbi:MAG: branched-chain amino acid ABC transporter permease [Myxococcaceae bacterium]|nr:branched-chain amino acid ABC transporter permease [Myxococcaceae bacterium]